MLGCNDAVHLLPCIRSSAILLLLGIILRLPLVSPCSFSVIIYILVLGIISRGNLTSLRFDVVFHIHLARMFQELCFKVEFQKIFSNKSFFFGSRITAEAGELVKDLRGIGSVL